MTLKRRLGVWKLQSLSFACCQNNVLTRDFAVTFGGLSINPETAAVVRENGSEIGGLYAAGELVGGLFYSNYPGGSGLTAGGVWGRRAGNAAAARIQDIARTQTS